MPGQHWVHLDVGVVIVVRLVQCFDFGQRPFRLGVETSVALKKIVGIEEASQNIAKKNVERMISGVHTFLAGGKFSPPSHLECFLTMQFGAYFEQIINKKNISQLSPVLCNQFQEKLEHTTFHFKINGD